MDTEAQPQAATPFQREGYEVRMELEGVSQLDPKQIAEEIARAIVAQQQAQERAEGFKAPPAETTRPPRTGYDIRVELEGVSEFDPQQLAEELARTIVARQRERGWSDEA